MSNQQERFGRLERRDKIHDKQIIDLKGDSKSIVGAIFDLKISVDSFNDKLISMLERLENLKIQTVSVDPRIEEKKRLEEEAGTTFIPVPETDNMEIKSKTKKEKKTKGSLSSVVDSLKNIKK